jgi:hypothetical protein
MISLSRAIALSRSQRPMLISGAVPSVFIVRSIRHRNRPDRSAATFARATG